MNLKIPLQRKPIDFKLSDCLIDRVITVPQAEFDSLVRHPMNSNSHIAEHTAAMFQDEKGMHCLLVLGEDSPDGLVIEAEGYDYARYAAYLPGARTLVKNEVEQAIGYLLYDAMDCSPNGRGSVTPHEMECEMGISVREGSGFDELLLNALRSRGEVAEAAFNGTAFITTIKPEFIHAQPDTPETAPAWEQKM